MEETRASRTWSATGKAAVRTGVKATHSSQLCLSHLSAAWVPPSVTAEAGQGWDHPGPPPLEP